jgi:aspartyl-tRNA(Asn)/glutamyl-tRNA(Gln) amidotransferase subunit A
MAIPSHLSLTEAADLLRSGDLRSVDLTQACLDRIHALDERIHAFLALEPDLALRQAEAADARLAAWRQDGGDPPSPVCGIPAAVKDVLCVQGLQATAGSKILQGFRPTYTATSVARLIERGMVVLGKTNTDEFAMGSSTENSAYGPTRNPWDPSRVPGGSSGLAPLALGSDTGGSIRQPAAFCGVTGIKPSYGRVSRYGLIAYGSSLDSVGALAQSAADLAPVFSAMAGHDPLDSTSLRAPVPSISVDGNQLTGLKLGVPDEYFIEGLQDSIAGAVRAAVDVMRDLGADVQTISLPHTDLALPVYYLIAPSEASANLARFDGIRFGPRAEAAELMQSYLETRGNLFGPEVKRRIMLGTYALSAGYYDAYYGQAQRVRTLIKHDFEQAFEAVDLIACPITPTTAFTIGEHGDDPLSMYLEDIFTLPANLAGVPGLAFPVGFDNQGLPIGMQILAAPLNEPVLFRAAQAYQSATDWHKEHPAL